LDAVQNVTNGVYGHFYCFIDEKSLKTRVMNVDYTSHNETELNLAVQKVLFWTDVKAAQRLLFLLPISAR
jgi:hypothetical protein